jgi:hypothetical protein
LRASQFLTGKVAPMNTPTDYRKQVEYLAEVGSSEGFSSGRPEHIAVVFETFLKHATKHVRIFYPDFETLCRINDQLTERLEMALENGVRVEIIARECDDLNYSPVIKQAIERCGKSELFSMIDPTRSPVLESSEANFATMDTKAFFFQPDKTRPTGYTCMNEPTVAMQLNTAFSYFKSTTRSIA